MGNSRKFFGGTTPEILFDIAFTLYMFSNVFSATGWAYSADDSMTAVLWILKIIRYLSYLLFLYKIYLDSIHIKRKIIFTLIGTFLIIFISMINSLDKTVLFYFLVFWAARNISAKRLVQCILMIQVSVLFITVLCSQLGIVKDYVVIEGFRTRHYLGFRWASFAPGFFFFILLEYLFLRKGKISFCEYIFFALVDFWLFHMTGTRLAFAASLAFMTFSLFISKWPYTARWKGRYLKQIFLFVPWICAGFSIWCHIAYNPSNPVWIKVNSMLSSRLQLGNSAISQYGFTLWGQNIEWVSQSIERVFSRIEGYNYVDCSYLQIALQDGMIFLCFMLFAWSCLMAKAIREKHYYLCWILAAIQIYSMIEPRLLHLWYNPFLLLGLSSLSSGRDLPNKRFARPVKVSANLPWIENKDKKKQIASLS